ncbi:hypothetical protein ACWDA9_28495, partial [Streptomyces sp. NPDC001193]
MKRSGLADILPLTSLQEGMYFHSSYDTDAPDLYNTQLVLDLQGPLDAPALRAGVEALLTPPTKGSGMAESRKAYRFSSA